MSDTIVGKQGTLVYVYKTTNTRKCITYMAKMHLPNFIKKKKKKHLPERN